MAKVFKMPLVSTVQPKSGYGATNPSLTDLVTDEDASEQFVNREHAALEALLELCEAMQKQGSGGLSA